MRYLSHSLKLNYIIISLVMLLGVTQTFAQPGTTIDLEKEKPQQYKNKILRAEKTPEDKKIKPIKRFFSNLVSRYNYFFNANNRFNEVILKVKAAHKDDYTQLLPFYNYSITETSKNKSELDTVLYKCTAGILLHDLRTDWVDELYMLMGKSYLYKQYYDSAYYVFQYINYIYAPKEDGYDKPIGSNMSNEAGLFTISNNEKQSLLKKAIFNPVRRNDCLLWIVKTYLEQDELGKARSLINILQNDPQFPSRLKTNLYELRSYMHYKEQNYDSSAAYLLKAIPNAEDRMEKARWYYLAAQMLQITHHDSAAVANFEQAIHYTTDPYLDVYARLNIVKIAASKQAGKNAILENLNQLHKLGRRDKYEEYRDIIYYAAGVLQNQLPDFEGTKTDLLKSLKFSSPTSSEKNKDFLLLGDIHYDRKLFPEAYRWYDSVQISTLSDFDKQRVTARKDALKYIVDNDSIVHLQDSLLQLAQMPETERITQIKKLYKRIKKQQGEKEDNSFIDFGNSGNSNDNNNATFSTTTTSGNDKGSFYFNSSSLKSSGAKEFKQKWGNRPNLDNWRRQSAIENSMNNAPAKSAASMAMANPDMDYDDVNVNNPTKNTNTKANDEPAILTFEGMLLNVPVTAALKDSANQKTIKALYDNGLIFQDKLEEYEMGANYYEEIFKRNENPSQALQTLLNLAYCYKKVPNMKKYDSVMAVLNKRFAQHQIDSVLNSKKTTEGLNQATVVYEKVYTLFENENYDKAIQLKSKADSVFGNKYWTPQLLFIESVYYIKQNDDKTAINKLRYITDSLPKNDLTDKATRMIDILKNRHTIEQYLSKLQIEIPEEPVEKRIELDKMGLVRLPSRAKSDSIIMFGEISMSKLPAFRELNMNKQFAYTRFGYDYNFKDTNYIIIALYKVDPVYVTEAKNALIRTLKDKNNSFADVSLQVYSQNLVADTNLIVIFQLPNATQAVGLIQNLKPLMPSKIAPWLQTNKYEFAPISKSNYDKLRTKKDLPTYLEFLKEVFKESVGQ